MSHIFLKSPGKKYRFKIFKDKNKAYIFLKLVKKILPSRREKLLVRFIEMRHFYLKKLGSL